MTKRIVGLLLTVFVGCGVSAFGASCTVNNTPPSEADKALAARQFGEAERLYGADLKAKPDSGWAIAGLVRTALQQDKVQQALEMALQFEKAHPADALVEDAVGAVRFRRGELDEAAAAFSRAVKLDPCVGRAHYDVGRYLNLSGMYASSQAELDTAHKLSPEDLMITRAWESTQRVPLTPEQQVLSLRRREELQKDTLSDEQKTALENTIKGIEARQKGDCELAEPVTSAKIPMYASNTSNNAQRPPTRSGVDVYLNGKRRRFLVDTGASGLLLSSDAAKSLGLTPEAEIRSFGIGDAGSKPAYVAHVAQVKIGGMEFHNCLVRVLEAKTLDWVDGLMGPDMFRSFVVTLDFPAGELRLSSLPKRPDEAAATPTLSTDGDQAAENGTALTMAQRKKDRYVAPEMKNWTPVFRNGHELIFKTALGDAPRKLFIMDTGAGQNLVSVDAAREVTKVSEGTGEKVKGISGEVGHVAGTDGLFLQFAHVRQQIPGGVNAIDMSSFSRGSGVEISGFIGYPILRQLVVQIDYRDNLVNVTYTPHVDPTGR